MPWKASDTTLAACASSSCVTRERLADQPADEDGAEHRDREARDHHAGEPGRNPDHHAHAAEQDDALAQELWNGHDEGVLKLREISEDAAGELAHLALAVEGHRHLDEVAEKSAAQVAQAELPADVEEQRLEVGHHALREQDGRP